MKTASEPKKQRLSSAFLWLFNFLFALSVKGQAPILTQTSTTCPITFTTTLAPLNTSIPETSVGLFYRLEGLNGQGSYFWSQALTTGTTVTSSLTLPIGSYSVMCVETRKSGPIRTGYTSLTVNNSGTCGAGVIMPTTFPTSAVSERAAIAPQWNVFTNSTFSNPTVDLCVAGPTCYSSATPWLFVTLSVEKWASFPPATSDVKVFFGGQYLDYVGAIASNYYGVQNNTNWQYIQSVTPAANDLTVKRKSGPAPPNQETHIHLIFKIKPNSGIDTLSSIPFTIRYTNSSGSQTATATAPVKGKPHDPNGLIVNKKKLCTCQASEWLTYQINFQNVGSARATSVKLEFLEPGNLLDKSNIKLLPNHLNQVGKSSMRLANVTKISPNTFIVDNFPGGGLAGLTQPKIQPWETSDYFKVSVIKKSCLTGGQVINPKVKITFLQKGSPLDPIDTNLESTTIENGNPERPCPKPYYKCTACTIKVKND